MGELITILLPTGVVNFVTGLRARRGQLESPASGIDKVVFHCSTEVGQIILKASAAIE